ncbi:tetratricopeptide repeat protein [Natronincola ferrireducens]|uniref:Predicted ATPase n=1 Tax=Natronincola ferrireducens TaxID=393762 RepID=A0A1G9HCX3_9FIRM|nr:tetratricopeptide repeat protein [Natronincola ferrireducens]SDL10898.1 Predicted ATPase [Natronincola ferrireducens]
MTTITGKLLGNPIIYKDNQQIIFPYKKAEALFYYLLIEKRASREILVNLFWGTAPEDMAKKNLRNAVYMIKKAFNEEVLVSPQRSIITLSPHIHYEIDIEDMVKDRKILSLEEYNGEFLEGFFVRDATDFEDWMFDHRNKYRDSYIHKLYQGAKDSYGNNQFKNAEKYCKILIQRDEFDERAYRILMMVYKSQRKYNQAIEVYHELAHILNEELSIAPDTQTTKLLEEIIKEKSIRDALDKKQHKEFFYGREKELQIFKKIYGEFVKKPNSRSIIITGEAGIGKSKLLDYFIKSSVCEEETVLFTHCYQAEENYSLKPWNRIFSKVSNIIDESKLDLPILLRNIVGYVFPSFSTSLEVTAINPVENLDSLKYPIIENAIIDILERVAKYKKIILVFEDLQWADAMTMDLIKSVILKNRSSSIMVITTCRNEYKVKIDRFITELSSCQLIEKIDLSRFNKQETINFAKQLLPKYSFHPQLKDLIYKETEGNAFFLTEFLNNIQENRQGIEITGKMEDIIKSRFLNISEEGKKILNILSVFFDAVSLDYLEGLSGKTQIELMEIIEELQDKNILMEEEGNQGIELVFTHQKLREYLYKNLSLSRKKLLHHKVGCFIEGQLTRNKKDILLYSKLIYHFTHSSNWMAVLKYNIKNLETYLDFNHEIFPIVDTKDHDTEAYYYLKQKEAKTKLEGIKSLLEKIKTEKSGDKELKKLEIDYLYMMGRLSIKNGNYDKGLQTIREVIVKALEEEEIPLALKSYRQMIYYCVNTQNLTLMEGLIEKALQTAGEHHIHEEIAILYRLKGLLKIMEGFYEEGEELLKEAIIIFNSLSDSYKYLLNIAAAYNFIGESKRHSQRFEEAVEYYKKAIAICQEKKIVRGLAIFQINAGLAYLAMEENQKAKEYFNKALKIYKKLDFLWGRSIAYGHLALLLIKEKQYEEALQYLLKAEINAEKLKSPYEIALVLRVKAEISREMSVNKEVKRVFDAYIDEDTIAYCNEGINIMKDIKGYYERSVFEELKKNCEGF